MEAPISAVVAVLFAGIFGYVLYQFGSLLWALFSSDETEPMEYEETDR